MLKIPMAKMKKYEILNSSYNKRIGTLKLIKFSFNLYYICFKNLENDYYECYCLDEEFYNEYKGFYDTKLTRFDELDDVYVHCKWQEHLMKEN